MNFWKLNMLMKLGREFGHETIRHAGISDTKHAICTYLYYHDKVSQDSISAALLFDKTTVAKALCAMESEGLISKRQNEKNKRKNVIQITDAGKSCVVSNVDIYENWLIDVCSCLTEQELQQFNGYFDRVVENALKIRHDAPIK